MVKIVKLSRIVDSDIYVASREYFVEPDTYIRMEVNDYCGWSYKFLLKNSDEDDHYELKGLEIVVAIRVYRRLDNNLIKRIVKAIAKNKDRRREEELLIRKDVDGEEYPFYFSTKLEGMNFILRYLG